MNYDAVIFDLFGTLVDNMPPDKWRDAQADTAETFGVSLDEFLETWSSIRFMRDDGRFGSLQGDIAYACCLFKIMPEPGLIEKIIKIRLEKTYGDLKPKPTSLSTLSKLRDMGLKTALVSDCGFEIPILWPDSSFAPLFDAAVFSCDARAKKPDPKVYTLACDQLCVDPKRCLYIGDGGSRELTGALAMGMTPILINVGYESYLDEHRADAMEWTGPVIKDLSEVVNFVS